MPAVLLALGVTAVAIGAFITGFACGLFLDLDIKKTDRTDR